MYPLGKDNTYVPAFDSTPGRNEPSIDYVREHGVVVSRSPDGTVGTVEVHYGLVVSFCAVTLNADGSINDFARKHVNLYARATKDEAATAVTVVRANRGEHDG